MQKSPKVLLMGSQKRHGLQAFFNIVSVLYGHHTVVTFYDAPLSGRDMITVIKEDYAQPRG